MAVTETAPEVVTGRAIQQEQRELPKLSPEALVSTVDYSNMVGQGQRNAEKVVIAVQQKLKESGLYKGKVDGKFGPETKEAILAHQKTNPELKNDGIVGPRTAASLLGKPLPPRPVRYVRSSMPAYNSKLYRNSFSSVTDLGHDFTVKQGQTTSHEEGLRRLGIDPMSLKRDRNGNLLTDGAISSQGLQISSSTRVIGSGFGQTGLKGVEKKLLDHLVEMNLYSLEKTGKGLRITGGRELGSADGTMHAKGSHGHLFGKATDVARSADAVVLNNPDFKRLPGGAGYGKMAYVHKETGAMWVRENTHWDVKYQHPKALAFLEGSKSSVG